MKISFWGAARTVTGSCYLVEHDDIRFLVDCGMFQGNKALKERNYGSFPFNPTEIDFVLLTHAHVDHSGMLPKLYKHGYQNPIYTSSATAKLTEIMMPDSGYIQEMEVERKNRKLARAGKPLLEPIYTAADAMEVQRLMVPLNYDEEFSPAAGIRVIMHDAGHILGSSMLEIFYQEDGVEKTLVFTGDLGRNDQAIIEDPYHISKADFVVMESTYGNREHGAMMNDELPHFVQVVRDTFARGGNVIIPAFAVDRTQEILYMINDLQSQGEFPDCTVYVDSPMAVKATEVFAQCTDYYDAITRKLMHDEGRPPFMLKNLVYSRTAADSMQLNNVKNNAIIISASGMADAGRIKHHLKHNLWRPECSVMFFGYQAEGTLGRRLIEGEKKVTIHGEEIDVKAEIHNMEGFSAHADKNELMTWLKHFEKLPERIFVTHGEATGSEAFAELVKAELGVEACVPDHGSTFDLAAASVSEAETVTAAVSNEQLLLEINQSIMELALHQDIEKLMRVRDYIKQVS